MSGQWLHRQVKTEGLVKELQRESVTKGGQGWAHSSGWRVRAGNAQR